MSAESLSQPPESRAVVEWEEGGFTLVIPPSGFRAFGRGWAFCLLLAAILTALSVVGSLRLVRSPDLIERLLWVVLLLAVALVFRPLLLMALNYLLDESLGRVTLVAGERGLYAHWRGAFRTREIVWHSTELEALDEDGGVLCLLVRGQPQTLLTGRGVAELRWIAGLLRETLHVPAEPPVADGLRIRCVPAAYSFSWRGLLRAAPGSLEIHRLLRPGEQLRFCAGKPTLLPQFLKSRTPILTPDSITWLPRQGSMQSVLIHFRIDAPLSLRLDSDEPEALRAALARFFESVPATPADPLPAPQP